MQSSLFLTLDLLDGNHVILEGKAFGFYPENSVAGEVVFQTGMVGYPESLSDPSYHGQILVLTYPLIGSYGIPNSMEKDEYGLTRYFESDRAHVKALVVGEYVNRPSHHLMRETLQDYLVSQKVVGIEGIDTRYLTELIRTHGTLKGIISSKKSDEMGGLLPLSPLSFMVSRVDLKFLGVSFDIAETKILVIDCGIKNNQLRLLLSRREEKNLGIMIVGISMIHEKKDLINIFDEYKCNRLFISNGPGDPRDCIQFIESLKEFLLEKKSRIPIFGICLGHQLLALASGLEVEKMKYGNRGHNLPCRLVDSQPPRTFQTTQNHGYAVVLSEDSEMDWSPLFININDKSNEGLIHLWNPWFSVQFHPEAKAGPEDTSRLFDLFIDGSVTKVHILLAFSCLKEETPEVSREEGKKRNKVLLLGSGGLSIGQSGEFDYSGSQAIKAFKEEGLTVVLVNPNIATVQTTPGFVDHVYFLPVNYDYVCKVIEIEHPDCIALSFGGQTALNCGIELYQKGILKDIEVLGTPIESIILTEDRDAFKRHIQSIGESIPNGVIAHTMEEALEVVHEQIGFPVLVRAAFTLGGQGSGFASNDDELIDILNNSFSYSSQVIIDKSFRGWKEIEYEIIRDCHDNCLTICNMENLDPLGVHTGESIVVAPSQTLNDDDYNRLRSTALKTARSLGIVGECNIQYALDPKSSQYFIIEINARLSRSSALASKATGYPLAFIAAKLGLGYALDELKNAITKTTTACSEPSLDYCVVKVPRWDLTKFQNVNLNIGSAMKSVGEGMAISRSFEEALQSALRMSGMNPYGLEPNVVECDDEELRNPTYRRILAIATALYNRSHSIDRLYELSGIDPWFLCKLNRITETIKIIKTAYSSDDVLLKAKKLGFSDAAIAYYRGTTTELAIRTERISEGIVADVKRIDTVSAEFPCNTNYLYLTFATALATPRPLALALAETEANNSVIVLGSGVYQIGSSVEFDWCAVNCIRELRKMGKRVIMINCNPETVSTDYDEADVLYFCEISLETVLDIYAIEQAPVIVSVGGQAPNNIALGLHLQGVPILGTSAESIDQAENRYKFSRMLDRGGIDQPQWKELESIDAALDWSRTKYPVLVRPSYVLSGAAMNVAYNDQDLQKYLNVAECISRDYPVVISQFILNAKEIEVDAVAKEGQVQILALSEHVENAGVHSGDATLVFPAQDITEVTRERINNIVYYIAETLQIHGPFNIQFLAKNDEIKVIECNLRVSRSFPFVSKTMNLNMIEIATRIMLDSEIGLEEQDKENSCHRVGVKVPQFSFHRLVGADILLGVEMQSTGEVACFGKTLQEAYTKALIASGFKMPPRGSAILISIGGHALKKEFKTSIEMMKKLGYQLYGTRNTASYFKLEELLLLTSLPDLKTSKGEETLFTSSTAKAKANHILQWIGERKFALIINVSERNKLRLPSEKMKLSSGYLMRQAAITYNIPILTDIKTSKLLVQSLSLYDGPKVDFAIDCFTSYNTIRLPGLIDVHVHVREPGATQKEDWTTCTQAAIAGGITMICAMPNTTPALTNQETFEQINQIALEKSYCDFALFAGATKTNAMDVHRISDQCAGLKMYLNQTHNSLNELALPSILDWIEHIKHWDHPTHPICVHAENVTLGAILHLATMYQRRIHVCHVSSLEEITLIRMAKETSTDLITCEVCPHHLFLTSTDADSLTSVRPPLQTKKDRLALWRNLDIIDCFATDHAPHLVGEKLKSHCPGFPGLETALPLLLTAVSNGLLTLDDIILRYHTNPKKIFNLPDQPDTYIEIDMNQTYQIPEQPQMSKAKWTPFSGFQCKGAIKRVVLRGEFVYLSDKPMEGMIIKPQAPIQNIRSIRSSETFHKKVDFQPTKKNNIRLTSPSRRPSFTQPNYVDVPKNPFNALHILSSLQFTKENLRILFEFTDQLRHFEKTNNRLPTFLEGKRIGLFFFEPSTRTKLSFECATKRLGGEPIFIDATTSSIKKGESLEDSIQSIQFCGQVDAIVLRHPENGAAQKASLASSIPIINGGDGSGEHPTQTLIDLYTIRNELGSLGGIAILFVGDLLHSRTVHSLIQALCLRDNVRFYYVTPPDLHVPQELWKYVQAKGIEQHTTNLQNETVLKVVDVIYVTRMQSERHSDPTFSIKYDIDYCITPSILAKTKIKVRVLHPLPRGHEISTEIDNDPRAAYKRQMENGPYVRMALLSLLLNK